jgi:hypothetical protein
LIPQKLLESFVDLILTVSVDEGKMQSRLIEQLTRILHLIARDSLTRPLNGEFIFDIVEKIISVKQSWFHKIISNENASRYQYFCQLMPLST